MTTLLKSLFLLWACVCAPSWAEGYAVSSLSGRVFVVADTHGDYTATVHILRSMGLINKKGEWSGGEVDLVINGDMVGKGTNSYQNIHFLIALQKSARRKGGRVHILPGNHELRLLEGDYGALGKKDLKRFTKAYGGVQEAFQSDKGVGKWMASAPPFLLIDDTLVVHGGIDQEFVKLGPSAVAKQYRKWIRYLRDEGDKPSKESSWVVGKAGPLESRKLVSEALSPEFMDELKREFGVKRVILAHTPTGGEVEALEKYEYRVYMGDSGNSRAIKKGGMTAIELHRGKATVWGFEEPTQEAPVFPVSSYLQCDYAALSPIKGPRAAQKRKK